MLDTIVKLFAPFQCLGCGQEKDRLICRDCKTAIFRVPSRCYFCKATTRQYDVCERCKRKTPLRRVGVWAHHEGLAKELIHTAKYERARSGFDEVAECLAELLPYFGDDCVIVPVPTASSRVRERGYDQAEVIARCLTRKSGLPYRRLLARLGQAHQVGASRRERLAHVRGAFRPLHEAEIDGAHIILIDDVCTTGATLEAAATVLRQAGASRVDALVFAQPD